MVSDIGCWVEGRELTGLLHYYAILLPGVRIDEVQNEIDRIFNDAVEGKITERELTKIKNRIETRNIYRLQTNLSKADMLSHFKTFYNTPGMINSNLSRYMSVTLDDIQNAAKKYLSGSGRVILEYLPKEEKNKFSKN